MVRREKKHDQDFYDIFQFMERKVNHFYRVCRISSGGLLKNSRYPPILRKIPFFKFKLTLYIP